MGLIELRLECAALPSPREYQIVSCELFEGISRPTRARITLSSESRFDHLGLLDAAATFRAQHDDSERQWSFLIEAARYTGFRDERHQYVIELAHPIALLARRHNTRAFQKRTLRKIVEEVLAGCNIATDQIIWKMSEDPTREYIVQYRESDLALLHRLLFEDGANYLLTIVGGKPVVVVTDALTDAENPDLGEVPLIDGAHGNGITDFDFECAVESAAYSTGDYNYLTADTSLHQSVPTAEGCIGDWYEYPGGFADAARGAALAKRRAEARLNNTECATGCSEVVDFEPGKHFTLARASSGPVTWGLVEVSHQWVLRSDHTNQAATKSYSNTFRCVPRLDFYRVTWPRLSRAVEGPLGAVVTTQGGEEIHTDQIGEAKARFFWDRVNPATDEASCWLRVIQLPIGGSLAVARGKWEILARHLYGDPNRPILIARLDNTNHPAPYAYPDAGTGMSWKTLASPGAAKINEFCMEDSGGRQGFSMTAGTDYTCQVNNDKTESVTANEDIAVDVDHDVTVTTDQKTSIGSTWTKKVQQDASVNVTTDRTITVGTAETVTVSGSLTETVSGADTEVVGSNVIALAGMNVSKTSIGSQSLTVGGALIRAAGLGVSQAVGGLRTELIGGAKITAAGGGVTESVVGGFSTIVGGVMINAAGKNCSSTSTAASKMKVGGVAIAAGGDQVQLHAKKITIQVGAAAALLGSGGILALTAGSASFVGLVTIKASGPLKIKGAPNLPG